jgi:4-hydroxybenzoate polyprenyltransferase
MLGVSNKEEEKKDIPGARDVSRLEPLLLLLLLMLLLLLLLLLLPPPVLVLVLVLVVLVVLLLPPFRWCQWLDASGCWDASR